MSYEPAVLKGIAWLNEIKPNWREIIDWGMLDMRNPHHCILGQVFHNNEKWSTGFTYGIELILEEGEVSDWGFDIEVSKFANVEYQKLHQTWMDLA